MTSEPAPDLATAVERLAGLVQELSERLDVTQQMQDDLTATMARGTLQRRINKWAAVIMALILALAVAVGVNAYRLGQVQERTSNAVLCPLFALFVASVETPNPAAADADGDGTVTPAEQGKFDAAVQVIRDGFAALDCRKS